jgi:flagellar M-ring protein FliF
VPTGTSTNGTGYTTQSSTKNNAINSTTQTTTIPAGSVDRQTISVAIDKSAAKGISAATITKLVDGAAGVNTKRGDQVDVQVVPFSKQGAGVAQAAIQSQSGADTQQSIVKIATTAVTVFGVLLGLFLLFRFLSSAAKRRDSSPLDLGPLDSSPLGAPDHEYELPEYPLLGAGSVPPPLGAGSVPPLPLEAAESVPEYARMRASIDRLSATDPQRTAEYMRSLMDEKQAV